MLHLFARAVCLLRKIVALMLPSALLMLCAMPAYAQKEANIWYFGTAGVDFNSKPPRALADSKMSTFEGCSSISDKLGRLLFYTDGQTVWDRLHRKMPNGFQLNGDASSTHSSVIVKKPYSDSVYYIITADDWTDAVGSPNKGVCFSIVDLTLNNGYGDISTKNIMLVAHSAEKIAATIHRNGSDVWIVIPEANTDKTHIFLLTENGISKHSENSGFYLSQQWSWGQIKFSPDGTKIATTSPTRSVWYDSTTISIADFDNKYGIISNSRIIRGSVNVYGLEFSPNSTFLYLQTWLGAVSRLCQCPVKNSDLNYATDCIFLPLPASTMISGQLQMAPDGNIYLPRNTNLGAILDPDSLAPKCRYVDSAIALAPGTTAFFGLPTFYNDYVSKSRIQAENCCESDTVFIYADKDTMNHDSAHWFVNGRRIPGRYFSCATVISDTGYASIMLVIYNPAYTDTLYKDVYIRPSPPGLHHPSVSICAGDSAPLQAWSPGISGYTWNTGSRDSSITVNQAGVYTVIRSKGGCSRQENIPVNVKPELTIGLPHDTFFCQYSMLVLSVAEPGATYLWSTGDTTATLQVTTPGLYNIHISKNGCDKTGSILVNQVSAPDIKLGRDTTICRQTPLKLRAYHPYSTYTWSDNRRDSILVVNTSGTYSVTVSNFCGSASDTITVSVKECKCNLFVPNAFTPNADGANDRFIPVSNCSLDEYRLSIFDRWGRMLFETTDPYAGWDGQAGDAHCTSDTYVWRLMYSVSPPLGTGQMLQQNGTVTLLR